MSGECQGGKRLTNNKDENNTINSKKELFIANLNQRQQEAKLVRRVVVIVALVLIMIVAVVGTSGYFYIKSALKPVNPDSDKDIVVEVPIGSGVSTISQLLEDKGLVKMQRCLNIM